ncbi:MAG: hypothetical protein NHB32_15610 [Fischerella sp. CENA71]|nr:hypothetical protein [Fischerella sp. CENA71]
MQNLISYSNSLLSSEPALLSDISLTENLKTKKPKLSMIWVKEFDGERQRLVAKWIIND